MNDQINRRDLDIILEVNRKSVELETEVAEQNEKIIEMLDENLEMTKEVKREIIDSQNKIIAETKDLDSIINDSEKKINIEISRTESAILGKLKTLEDSLTSINKKAEENSKDILTIRIILGSGIISLVIQIVQMFLKH